MADDSLPAGTSRYFFFYILSSFSFSTCLSSVFMGGCGLIVRDPGVMKNTGTPSLASPWYFVRKQKKCSLDPAGYSNHSLFAAHATVSLIAPKSCSPHLVYRFHSTLCQSAMWMHRKKLALSFVSFLRYHWRVYCRMVFSAAHTRGSKTSLRMMSLSHTCTGTPASSALTAFASWCRCLITDS